MAAEFPHVDFTSVDTIPLVTHLQFPNILGYEVYDLGNGIEEADETFDLVHVKDITPKVCPHVLWINCALTESRKRTGTLPHLFRRFTEYFDQAGY